MCFVWIWEQTAIISLHSINWLVFVTETERVYCAVRTGPIYMCVCVYIYIYTHMCVCVCVYIYIMLTLVCKAVPHFRRSVAGLSRLRSGFDPSTVHMRFVVNKMTLGEVLLPAFLFPLSVSFHQYSILIFIYTLLLPEKQMGKVWGPYKKQWNFGNRTALCRKVLTLFCQSLQCFSPHYYLHFSVSLCNASPHINTYTFLSVSTMLLLTLLLTLFC